NGEDVLHRRLLLPATAAHDRVHRRTLSLLVRAQRAVPLGADNRHEEGLASFAPGTLGTQPRIRPVRWHLRLSDPGGRRCLGRRLPVGAHRRIRRARLPGGGAPPAPAAERLARRAGPGRPGRRGLARAPPGRGIWLARGGRFAMAGGGGIAGAGCDGAGRSSVGRSGVLRGGAGRRRPDGAVGSGLVAGLGAGVGTVLIGLALALPPAFSALAVP